MDDYPEDNECMIDCLYPWCSAFSNDDTRPTNSHQPDENYQSYAMIPALLTHAPM